MKTYHGKRDDQGTASVFVEHEGGRITDLDPRFDLRRHSPSGFEWGYEGSGPAQLALALAADALALDDVAGRVYQALKRALVAPLARDAEWSLTDAAIRAECERIIGHDLATCGSHVPECPARYRGGSACECAELRDLALDEA